MSDDNFILDNRDKDIEDKIGEDDRLTIWDNYIFTKRQNFLLENKRHIGLEYDNNKLQWDMIFEREWVIIEERLNAGIGVEIDMRRKMGEGFFKKNKPLDDDIALMYDAMDEEQIDEDTKLRIYTFEDFNLLSNQGIFRDEVFIIDPQRKWKKKVKEALISYGYNDIERIEIKGGLYFVVSKKESE